MSEVCCLVSEIWILSVPAGSPDLAGRSCRVGDPTGTARDSVENLVYVTENEDGTGDLVVQ